MIQIKNTSVFFQLFKVPVDPGLILMVAWIEKRYPGVVITCGFEERDHPSVHSTDPLRGIDIRSRTFSDPEAVCEKINRTWIYDPDRPHKKCAIFHDVGRGAHIHLQTHPKTILKGR
ncbi:MAG: hypothetical protein MI862_26120 [Desulfobacterales bacterium]|nr:hypothetical protein [Desulfobacterales bacterium]